MLQVRKLKQKLDEEIEKNALSEKYSTPRIKEEVSVNGPDMQLLEVQSMFSLFTFYNTL